MKVDIFVPCFIDQLFPETAWNMVKVLEKAGCQVNYNSNQTCCGQPAFNAGFWEEASTVAKKFINDFREERYIVCPAGSCTGFIRNYYTKIFEGQPLLKPAQMVRKKVYEFSEFLVDVLEVNDLGASFEGIATYHDACGALRECQIKDAPRKLLKNVKGLELVETSSCETCCGFGGTFAVKYEPISTAMAAQKVDNVLAQSDVKYIISTDLSCLMHLEGYIRKHQKPLKTLHIADVLAKGI